MRWLVAFDGDGAAPSTIAIPPDAPLVRYNSAGPGFAVLPVIQHAL